MGFDWEGLFYSFKNVVKYKVIRRLFL